MSTSRQGNATQMDWAVFKGCMLWWPVLDRVRSPLNDEAKAQLSFLPTHHPYKASRHGHSSAGSRQLTRPASVLSLWLRRPAAPALAGRLPGYQRTIETSCCGQEGQRNVKCTLRWTYGEWENVPVWQSKSGTSTCCPVTRAYPGSLPLVACIQVPTANAYLVDIELCITPWKECSID
jgi:hypothetical protein